MMAAAIAALTRTHRLARALRRRRMWLIMRWTDWPCFMCMA